jgi:hypothetical protein
LTGSVSGAALGTAIDSVASAGAGSLIGIFIREFAHRRLSQQEQVRVGATLQFVAAALKEHFDAGHPVRRDEYFSVPEDGRPPAEEILEGVLLTAQRGHEAQKVEYLGYLAANLAFEPHMDPYLGNWAIKTAGELTWVQLVLLALIGDEENRDRLPDVEIKSNPPSWNSFGIHEQLADLGYGRRGLIYGGPRETPNNKFLSPDIRLREQKLGRGGLLLQHLMWLDRIPPSSRVAVVNSLTERAPKSDD